MTMTMAMTITNNLCSYFSSTSTTRFTTIGFYCYSCDYEHEELPKFRCRCSHLGLGFVSFQFHDTY